MNSLITMFIIVFDLLYLLFYFILMVEEKPTSSQHNDILANEFDGPFSDDKPTERDIERQKRKKTWVKEQIKWEKSLPKGYPLLSKRQKMLAAISEINQAIKQQAEEQNNDCET